MSTDIIYLMALIFGACSLLVIGINYSFTGSGRDLSRRLKDINRKIATGEADNTLSLPPTRKLLLLLSRSALKFGLFKRLAIVVDRNLAGADILLKSEEYIILTAGLSILGGVVTTLLFMNVYYGFITGIFAIILSILWIRVAKGRRLNKFNSQIGDALVIISNALRSGFSFLQAMDMVRKELPNPIAKEFGRTFQEMNLGTHTEDALENLNARVGSDDMELVITAVLIQRQVGGNLAEILDNIAGTIRERIRIKGEIRTLTAQGKISGIVIGVLPVILAAVLAVMSPDYLKTLVTHPLGIGMLTAALVLELIGILLIRKIIDIKV